ncbi:hypothetical protein F66182_4088 [Fusarium sp. NRRL 66182]|nr:hypothetical protein F66182_4088 [Fusarium sp. NRRL 66182]
MPQTSRPNQSRAAVPPSESQQIASSNQTVNAFLGGRRRSWMTGISSTDTNPRPAPLPSSNSRKRNQKRKASGSGPPIRNDNDHDIQRDNIPTDQSAEQPPSAGEPLRAQTVLPSPALTDAPSPNVSNQADCNDIDASPHVEGTGPGRPVSDSNMNPDDPISVAHIINHPTPTAAASQAESSSPQIHSTEASARPTVVDPASTGLAPLQTTTTLPPSIPEPQQCNSGALAEQDEGINRNPPATTEHQAKRPRLQGPSEPIESRDRVLCRQWCTTIEYRIAQSAQAGLLNETVEKPRFRILLEACQICDFFYIAFHQVLCAWSMNRSPVYALFHGLVEPKVLDDAFTIVQSILRKNEFMSATHLQWFANFPTPVADLSRGFASTPAAHDIATFLNRLSSHWHSLIHSVKARKYPLLACEVTGTLHCRGRGLQTMLFTMSRRCLGIQDNPGTFSMITIFEQDRDEEALFSARGEAPEIVHRARENTAKRYKDAIASQQQYQQQRQLPQSNAAPSPVFGHNTPTTEQSGPQPVAQPPLMATNLPQPTHTTAPPPSLPHFSTLISHPARGSPRVTSPAVVNNYLPPGNSGPQGPRGPNHLLVQTDPQATSPTSSASYHSPQMQQNPLPRSSSAGLPQANLNLGSPNTQQVTVLPSNGQLRTPFPSQNAPFVQRRVNSFAYPSQSLPSNYGVSSQQPPGHPQSAGPTVQARPQRVASPAQTMPPRQTQMMHPQQNQMMPPLQTTQRRASTMQYNTMPAASPNQIYTTQAAGVQQSVFQAPTAHQVPIPTFPTPQLRPIRQIPEAEYPSSPYGQVSLQVGLHHIDVRSPRRIPSKPGRSRYYQFVRQLVYRPVGLVPQTGLRSLPFNVPEDHIQRLARKVEGEGLPYCSYSEDPAESDWVLLPTSWPNHVFFDLNKHHLELRRKQHFSKDQPLELTDFLAKGENVLRVSFPAVDQNLKPGYKYFMAIEIVETISHEAAHSVIQAMRHIPQEETRLKIQRRLRPSDSDDIIIEDETLTISLADPFSATRFTVPVRGAQCKHLECFDLETWLSTRPQKPFQKGGVLGQKGAEPSLVDAWKCPICGLDARPISLWVDDYLTDVRQRLLSKGDMRTKMITVTADGKWTAVPEPDDSDDDSPAPQLSAMAHGNANKHTRPVAAVPARVIEILDDD